MPSRGVARDAALGFRTRFRTARDLAEHGEYAKRRTETFTMGSTAVRAREKDSLAQFLGWFSVALGSAQLAAPRAMCRLVGARGDGMSPLVMRLMGAREMAQ